MTPGNHIFKRGGWGLALAVVILAVAWLQVGCAEKTTPKRVSFMDDWKLKAEQSRGHSPTPRSREIDLPAPKETAMPVDEVVAAVEAAPPERTLPTAKVTMNMRHTDISLILQALARTAGQNIMMNDSVGGITNINVKDTPWNQVFEGILRTRGLAYGWEGNIIRIMTLEDMANDRKIEASQQQKKAQKVEAKMTEPLITRIVYVDYGDAESLAENMTQLITTEKNDKGEGKMRGAVTVDKHNNALIIQASPDDMARMIPLIEKLDRPTPQILIEANIVETTSEVARELGIQWGGLYRESDGGRNNYVTSGSGATGVLGEGLSAAIVPLSGQAISFPATMADNATFTIGYVTEKVGDYILNVQLSALQKEGLLNILSSPSITTLDNQTAFTENGEKVPYVTITDGNREVSFEDAVLRLEIKPHVIDGRSLKMDVKVLKDEVDTSRNVEGNPFIIKKHTETSLIVQDGETIVISGLTKHRNVTNENGVPTLKDIPFLGRLLRGDFKNDNMEEVMIFITPHILKTSAQARQG